MPKKPDPTYVGVCKADLGLITRRSCYTNRQCRSEGCCQANVEYLRAYGRSPAGQEANRKYHNFYRYGITADEFDDLLVEQDGVCAICRKDCVTGDRLSIDHDHDTDQVRGLLCRRCNAGLGHFDDNPDLVATALSYLMKSGESIDDHD